MLDEIALQPFDDSEGQGPFLAHVSGGGHEMRLVGSDMLRLLASRYRCSVDRPWKDNGLPC
jgi:hypothetical protein